jgi:type IV pilus assembly protein PilM
MAFSLRDFFTDIKNFFSFKRVLGVDIGTTSIKVVEIMRAGGSVHLENYGILETKDYLIRGNEAIQTSSLKIVERDATKLLKVLINEMKPKARRAFVAAPSFGVFAVPIEMPRLTPAETSRSISFQARQYIPLPVTEVTLDWVKLEDFENQRGQLFQRVLLTAIPNDLIKKYKNIFHGAGLSIAAMEIESFSATRALIDSSTPTSAILDIGAESSSISIVDGGIVRYVGQTDYGGLALTQALARTLDISAFRAEELKRRRGLVGTGGEYELSTSLMPFLDVIIQECSRVIATYETKYQKKVKQVILIGGGANLPGAHNYVSEQIKLPVQSSQALSRFKYRKELEPLIKNLNNDLVVALGVALKAYVA